MKNLLCPRIAEFKRLLQNGPEPTSLKGLQAGEGGNL